MLTAGRMLKQAVTVEPFTAVTDAFGDARTYGTAVTYRARVAPTKTLVRTDDGREVVASWQAWILVGTTTLGSSDRITLPDGTTPDILRIEQPPDQFGRSRYVKVFLG